MTLPKRLYFTLDKAAVELGCDIADIIHFAANGYVNLCIKVVTQDNTFANKPLPEWRTDLAIDVEKFHDWISEYFLLENMKYSLSPEGVFLAQDDTTYEFVNDFLKVKSSVNFWVEKESQKIWKYEVSPVSIKGLLQIPFKWIYNSEFSLLDGGAIIIKAFQVPESNSSYPIVGRFSHDNTLFHTDFVAVDVLAGGALRCGPSNFIKRDEPVEVYLNDFLITVDEIDRLKGLKKGNSEKGHDFNPNVSGTSDIDNPKSLAVYAGLITSLIAMISDTKDVDINKMSPVRLKEILTVIASKKGIAFPDIHPQTLAKYLGRERSSR